MKTKHIAALIREDLTTVAVVFREPGEDAGYFEFDPAEDRPRLGVHTSLPLSKRTETIRRKAEDAVRKRYTFKVLRSDAANLAAGDYVVCDTSKGLHVGRIFEVHETPQIDPDFDGDYRWIVQKLDMTKHEAVLAHERELNTVVLSSEREMKRKSIVDTYKNALLGSPAATRFEELSRGPSLPAPAPAKD